MSVTSDSKKFESCDGRPLLLEWTIDRHLFFTFEIDTDAVAGALPEALDTVEIRPGISLLSLGILRYKGGHFGEASPPFDELVAAIHVPPDLSTRMPMPTMSFYAIAVFTDSPDFVAQEEYTIYTPAYHVPSLAVEYSADGLEAEAWDERGPIASVRNSHPEPSFTHAELWGQHYTNTKGLHHGIWEWDGRRFEHMRASRGDWKLHQHPLFETIDVTRVRRCYRQMMLEPGTLCRERFYGMRSLVAV